MQYLDTVFTQLEFALKIYNYALEKQIDLDVIDKPITFQDRSVLVLRDSLFNSYEELILACENGITISFGAAAIALNRCREEAGVKQPDLIKSELDQYICLVYQIRNAFAHDIAQPQWNIKKPHHIRKYNFNGISIDLSILVNKPFEYMDIGGIEVLFRLRDFWVDYLILNDQSAPTTL